MALKIKVNKGSYIYGLLIVSILTVIVIATFVIKPTIDDNKKQQKIIDNREEVIKKLEDKKSKLEKASSDFKELKEKAAKINMAIPDNEDRKSMVNQIYSIANLCSLNLEAISADYSSSGVESEIDSILLESSQEYLYSLSFKTANYKSLQDFIDYSKQALRLFSIKSINITGEDGNLEASMVVGFYGLGSAEEDPNEQI